MDRAGVTFGTIATARWLGERLEVRGDSIARKSAAIHEEQHFHERKRGWLPDHGHEDGRQGFVHARGG